MSDALGVEIERGDGQLRLAIALAGADTPSAIAAAVAKWGASASEADFANLALLDSQRSVLRVVHAASLDADIARRWTEFSLTTPTPLCDAVLEARPVLLGSLDDYVGKYDGLIPDTRAAGLEATASLPLRAPSGETIGALGFAWPQPQSFPAVLRARLDLIARLTAQALGRVGGQERGRAVAVQVASDLGADPGRARPGVDDQSWGGAAEIIAGWFIDFLEHQSPPDSPLSLSVLFERLDQSGWDLVRRGPPPSFRPISSSGSSSG